MRQVRRLKGNWGGLGLLSEEALERRQWWQAAVCGGSAVAAGATGCLRSQAMACVNRWQLRAVAVLIEVAVSGGSGGSSGQCGFE